MTAIDDVGDGFLDGYVAVQGAVASFMGIAGHDHELADFSPQGWAALDDLAGRTLAELRAAEVTSDNDRVTVTALTEELTANRELYAAGLATSNLNTAASPLQMIRLVFDLTGTDEGWDAVAARLAAVPDTLDGYRRGLAEEAGRGVVSARRQVVGCAEQCAGWSGHRGEKAFFTELVARYGDGPRRTELDRLAARASEAFAEFGRYLREDLAPLAPERDGVGAERYALWLRTHTGARLDLAETYQWGWEEFTRIRAEMHDVARTVLAAAGERDTGGDTGEVVERAVAVLDTDPARRIDGAENFRAWVQDLSDRTMDSLAGTHFDIPDPVRRLRCMIAPVHEGGCYYTAPTEDFSRPGQMWWALPEGVDSFGTWREATTVFHEGVPGHHLQIAQTMYRADRLNRCQRLLLGTPGHSEGWALYAERLMAELGYLDDPGERLGMLDSQMLRAARVILDVGMHLELPIPAGTGFHEGERWTRDLGLEFLRRHYHAEDGYRIDEVDRYLGWPGQAPSYKIGERVWLAAREESRTRHGDTFDLKAFHTAALNIGSIGLDQLRDELTRF
ncbi:MAG TPA: DUF885 domain-containing protein [Mycobacteriales bacterium]|nr:DUF885 domain-containing protein [Mycobacteriales bacterium]